MKTILLIGEKYSSNLGDGIICDTVNYLLKDDNYEVITMDISGRKSFENDCNSFNLIKEYKVYFKTIIKKILNIFGYNKMGKNLSKIFTEFKTNFNKISSNYKFDYIIFAGGQMFIDTFINQINYVCDYATKNNIDIIFNCCGAGIILNKSALARVLNSDAVKYISVRDSYDKLKEYTDKKINLCSDNAVISSQAFVANCKKDNYNGIGIMFSTLQSPLKQVFFWKKLLKKLIKEKINFKVFTNGSYKDYCFAEYLLTSINLDSKQYLLKRPMRPKELVNQITSFKRILSMRLHSMIVAYSFNIPSVAICWDEKINSFFTRIGLKDNCFTLDSNIDKIIEKFEKIDENTINQSIKQEILLEINNNITSIKEIMEEKYEII